MWFQGKPHSLRSQKSRYGFLHHAAGDQPENPFGQSQPCPGVWGTPSLLWVQTFISVLTQALKFSVYVSVSPGVWRRCRPGQERREGCLHYWAPAYLAFSLCSSSQKPARPGGWAGAPEAQNSHRWGKSCIRGFKNTLNTYRRL